MEKVKEGEHWLHGLRASGIEISRERVLGLRDAGFVGRIRVRHSTRGL
jgi:hypothetical protein